MNTFLIREAMLSDAAAIAVLNREEMGYPASIADTEKRLKKLLADSGHKIFVAEVNGCAVGYLHLCDYDLLYYDALKNIMGIAVAKDCRKQGIGRALLLAGEEWAKQTGAVGVRLVSGSNRVQAHAFYQKCGYIGDKLQRNMKKVW